MAFIIGIQLVTSHHDVYMYVYTHCINIWLSLTCVYIILYYTLKALLSLIPVDSQCSRCTIASFFFSGNTSSRRGKKATPWRSRRCFRNPAAPSVENLWSDGIFTTSKNHLVTPPPNWCRISSIHGMSGWSFGTFFIFPYIGNNHPTWLIFFRGGETTNQLYICQKIGKM